MKDLDVLSGNDDCKIVKIGDKDYKIATLGPFVLGQVIGYIKDKRRLEIIETAKALGEVNLKEVLAATNEAINSIDETSLDKELGSIDVMTRLIYYSLKVYQPSLIFSDMGKMLTMERIKTLTDKIIEGVIGETENPPEQTPEIPATQ